jgi:hypothetical protein
MSGLFLATAIIGAVAVHAQPQLLSTAQIPFKYSEGQIWLETHVPGKPDALHFLLDSGAAASVLDEETARRLGLKCIERVNIRGVHTSTAGYWTSPLSCRVGNVEFDQKFLAVDLQKLSRASAQRVDGLLGADFLRGRIVQIDYAAETIRVLAVAPAVNQAQVLPLRNRRGAMRVPIRVNGSEAKWVRLDTGCASALQWVTANSPPADSSCQISIGLAEIAVPFADVAVQLGQEVFPSVRTGMHKREIFAGEAGLLGNGLLERFCVTVDAPGSRLILEKYSDKPTKP